MGESSCVIASLLRRIGDPSRPHIASHRNSVHKTRRPGVRLQFAIPALRDDGHVRLSGCNFRGDRVSVALHRMHHSVGFFRGAQFAELVHLSAEDNRQIIARGHRPGAGDQRAEKAVERVERHAIVARDPIDKVFQLHHFIERERRQRGILDVAFPDIGDARFRWQKSLSRQNRGVPLIRPRTNRFFAVAGKLTDNTNVGKMCAIEAAGSLGILQ